MNIKDIENFAKEKGFHSVRYVGNYKGNETYKPMMKNKNASIGKPFFILVNGDDIKLVTGSIGLEIVDKFYRYTIR